MINRDIVKLLEYEITRKPNIKKVYDNIDDYSENDIEMIPCLKWMRQALIEYKKKKLASVSYSFMESNLKTIELSPNTISEEGIVYKKIGDEWVKSLSSQILIPNNSYVFISGTHMWWGTTYFNEIPVINIEKIGRQNRISYISTYFT